MATLGPLGGSFAGQVGIEITQSANGCCTGQLAVRPQHFNNHQVVHGGVLFTLVDTVMGAALYTLLSDDELCATVDVHISYLNAVRRGPLICSSHVVKRGKRLAHVEAQVHVDGTLMVTAAGHFAMFARKI